ncbi:MAG: hypothetical protein JO324_07630 [Candidatus Eremiobacteraeota bacterium]|nr:hypothetical protein [Candidatus Eremiobacteraeota bacterium]
MSEHQQAALSGPSEWSGMPQGSPPVLIIRLDAIGDALALTPLLAALRRRDIPVDVVLSRANRDAFAANAIRRAIVAEFAPRDDSRANRGAIAALGKTLASSGYSHALVATEDPSGYRLARAAGAPLRIGFIDPLGKPLKALWSRAQLTRTVYRSAGMDPRAPHECEVLFRLGDSLLSGEAPSRDAADLRPLVLDESPVPSPCIAVQITDKWERMGIAFPQVVELVRRLRETAPLELLAAARESAYARRVADAAGEPITYFERLQAWKAAIAGATAVVAPDSGAMHVAGMTGTPVVAVFAPVKRYALQVARWSPWAAPHRIVRADSGWPARAADALAQLLSI